MNDSTDKSVLKRKSFKYYEKYMMIVGTCGQFLFYAQGFKIFKNQSAADVSLSGFLFGLISVSSWLLYGILIKNTPLIVANVVAVIGALLVVTGILLYA